MKDAPPAFKAMGTKLSSVTVGIVYELTIGNNVCVYLIVYLFVFNVKAHNISTSLGLPKRISRTPRELRTPSSDAGYNFVT